MITAPIVVRGLTSLARNSSSSFRLSAVISVLLNSIPCNSIFNSTLRGSGFGAGLASGFASGFGGTGFGGGGGTGQRSGVHCLQAAAAAARAGVQSLVRTQTVPPTAVTTSKFG